MLQPGFMQVADQRVAAAWAQLLAEDAGGWASPVPAKPARKPRPAHAGRPARALPWASPWPWGRLGWRLPLAINGVLALGLALALASGPLLASHQLQAALRQPEPQALHALVDWPTLRDNLAARMLGPEPAHQPPYLVALAWDVARGLASAEGLHGWVQAQATASQAAPLPRPLGTSGAWQATLAPAGHATPLVATLVRASTGQGWQVVDLNLPEAPEATTW